VALATGRSLVLWEQGFGFDLHAPFGIEQGSNDHGRRGPDCTEDFAMRAAYFFPVLGMGEEHAGAVDVLEGGASLGESGSDQLEYRAGLLCRREVVGADRAGSRYVDDVANAHCA